MQKYGGAGKRIRGLSAFGVHSGCIRGMFRVALSRKERDEKWAKKDKKRIELGKIAVTWQNYFEKKQ